MRVRVAARGAAEVPLALGLAIGHKVDAELEAADLGPREAVHHQQVGAATELALQPRAVAAGRCGVIGTVDDVAAAGALAQLEHEVQLVAVDALCANVVAPHASVRRHNEFVDALAPNAARHARGRVAVPRVSQRACAREEARQRGEVAAGVEIVRVRAAACVMRGEETTISSCCCRIASDVGACI